MANNVHAQARSTPSSTVPVIGPGHDFETVTETVAQIPLSKRTPLGWVFGFLIGLALLMGLQMALGKLLLTGIGIWGNNVPVGWAFDIINFVWWIGIGHAGTLISAILLLFKQQWRMSISRFAEAMTHLRGGLRGHLPAAPHRPPVAGGLLAVPLSRTRWAVAAVPQPAHLGRVRGLDLRHGVDRVLVRRPGARPGDDARPRGVAGEAVIFGMLSLGWRGSARHWHRYEVASLMLAGLSTPLVLSVHTVVSFDFAVSVMPGWHATIFPPYFVAGAIYSGFAMVLTLAIPIRAAYGSRTSSRCATSTTWPRSCWRPA
jgi:hypothetical protein